ncbi:MMPL family transporter [Agilicoccus flavus]|uniref:MMPL family transporter n=1 Tax=Agilicoccus flavus TaxID=2775968 RepID=UPI001CF6E13A|nr:MMPL family transporter [Agilicoccus flavus]
MLVGLLIANPPSFSTPDETASLIPEESAAAEAELRAVERFGFPLSSRTVVVQHDSAGLSPFVQAESILDALALNQTTPAWPVLGAIPLTNAVPLGQGQGETGTAVLTYMFMDPTSDFGQQHAAARQYTQDRLERPEDHVVGVAGSVPARAQQSYLLDTHLPLVETLTVAVIFLLVGLAFRSLVVPLVALLASGIAVVSTIWFLVFLSEHVGVGAPAELKPVVVALLLGVVTDYTIFYATGFTAALDRHGGDVREAIVESVGVYTPIVLAAGLTVAAGTFSLVVAESGFFRAFGPAMAATIVVGCVVSLTLVPALIAILGRRLMWPRAVARGRRRAVAGPAGHPRPADPADRVSAPPSWFIRRLTQLLVRPVTAFLAALVCVAALVACSLPLARAQLSAGFTSSLPATNTVSEASAAAAQAFAPGVTSPTTVLVEGDGVGRRLDALRVLQREIAAEPGVATVIGPGQLPLDRAAQGVVVSPDGNAARLLLVFDSEPLDARAIAHLAQLRERLPGLADRAGFGDARMSFAGDTALAEGLVSGTASDLLRIAVVGLLVNFVLLAGFLRALVAPVYLLLSSCLALTASLGLTTWLFVDVLGADGLVFYVPFAASVLLVSLGSDYNIFGVGRTWEEAHHHPLREAIVRAMPETSRAITTAGLALAVSFGMLAVIPLASFHQLAFAMAVGILIDALLVRTVLVPAMLTLVGRFSAWPRRDLGPASARRPESAGAGWGRPSR